MFRELGGLFGWLLVIAFGGTILNYCLKFVNKKWGKMISGNENGKKVMKLLMTIFVKNHKYFGFFTVVLLLAHFYLQFTISGINWTGVVAALLMVLQVILGIYANVRKRPRKGAWFVMHRTIAVLIIAAIAYHLIAPYAINSALGSGNSSSVSAQDTTGLPVFTSTQLATYNGQNGAKAYVAYKGVVYDVTDNRSWENGTHFGQQAGTDLTSAISGSPHGDTVFNDLPVVGSLQK